MRPACFLLLLSSALAGQTAVVQGQSSPQISSQTAPTSSQPRSVTVSLQTGFAETFQLTLGGMFGEGPAWQNRVTATLNNATSGKDAVFVTGWQTFDTPTHSSDWAAGFGYRRRVVNRPQHSLTLTGGVQKWRFPSVKTGTNDWLLASTALYQSKFGPFPVTVNSDAWTILYSPLPGGSLLNTQAFTSHSLLKSDAWTVTLRHGPSHTYSWNFYGTQGHRVLRYGASVLIANGPNVIEAGYRKQWALQPRIPENNFWMVSFTRSFNF